MINSSCINTNKPKKLQLSWTLFLLIGLAYGCGADAAKVEVFSVSDAPFIHLSNGLKPCYLDIASSQLNAINEAIKSTGQVDANDLRMRFSGEFNAISDSALCRNRAAALGLTKLPAVVFDDKDVIYGVLDVREALDMDQHHQEPTTW